MCRGQRFDGRLDQHVVSEQHGDELGRRGAHRGVVRPGEQTAVTGDEAHARIGEGLREQRLKVGETRLVDEKQQVPVRTTSGR